MNKTDLRTKAKNIRKNLPLEKISQKAVELIQANELYKNSKHIMIYYPMQYEINLLALLKDDKKFYLPRVNGKFLEVCPYKINDKLLKSDLNILEPTTKAVGNEILDLVIVPALMADYNNYRLGYGGGYYDRFINPNFKTIVVIPKDLCIEKLPIEKNDKKSDIVLII